MGESKSECLDLSCCSVGLGRDGRARVIENRPGDALIVPRGVWHRVRLREPSRLLHITPGPGGEHRPLPR